MSKHAKSPEDMTEAETKRRIMGKKAQEARAKREREWDAKKPGLDLYNNPDLPEYIERFKEEDPEFARFLEKVKSGQCEAVNQKILELAAEFEKELSSS